jgi:hypothetical protein
VRRKLHEQLAAVRKIGECVPLRRKLEEQLDGVGVRKAYETSWVLPWLSDQVEFYDGFQSRRNKVYLPEEITTYQNKTIHSPPTCPH